MNIIPRPKETKVYDTYFDFDEKMGIESEITNAEKIIQKYFNFASINNKDAKKKFIIKHSSELKTEAYMLDVNNDEILILASDDKGVFYAVQTLLQISGIAAGKRQKFNCCVIADEPRFAHRGFMLDEARHFFGKEFVKKQLDMMALLKLNVFHWHLTDDQGWRVEIKKYPLLTEKGSIRKNTQLNLVGYAKHKEMHDDIEYGKGLFYTQEDIKEIVEYAKELNIEVIPEIDMPGHLTAAIACYPELSCTKENLEVANRWGVMETIGCAGREELYNFVFDVIDELAPLFPSKYFHIGGDEVPKKRWKKCPHCQAKIKELNLKNEEELQGAFNVRVQNHLKSKGKNIIGWNEILKNGNINSDTIVQWWTGNCKKNGVSKWVEQGNSIIITSCQYVYTDYFYAQSDLRHFYSMDYDTLGLPEEYKDKVIGMECPMWTEYVRDEGKYNFNVYPRLQALAEMCWTQKKLRDFDDFNNRLKSFDGIFKKFNIIPAPENFYLCEGKQGKIRKFTRPQDWLKNPNMEYERFTGKETSMPKNWVYDFLTK